MAYAKIHSYSSLGPASRPQYRHRPCYPAARKTRYADAATGHAPRVGGAPPRSGEPRSASAAAPPAVAERARRASGPGSPFRGAGPGPRGLSPLGGARLVARGGAGSRRRGQHGRFAATYRDAARDPARAPDAAPGAGARVLGRRGLHLDRSGGAMYVSALWTGVASSGTSCSGSGLGAATPAHPLCGARMLQEPRLRRERPLRAGAVRRTVGRRGPREPNLLFHRVRR